jgi:hypothetical protein
MLTEQIEQLPAFLQQEVLDYVDFLKAKYRIASPPIHIDFSWEGGLADLRKDYDSVTLQHKILEWR